MGNDVQRDQQMFRNLSPGWLLFLDIALVEKNCCKSCAMSAVFPFHVLKIFLKHLLDALLGLSCKGKCACKNCFTFDFWQLEYNETNKQNSRLLKERELFEWEEGNLNSRTLPLKTIFYLTDLLNVLNKAHYWVILLAFGGRELNTDAYVHHTTYKTEEFTCQKYIFASSFFKGWGAIW